MKNSSFALLAVFVGLLPACSAGQDSSTTGATPSPTVTVPPTDVAEKPTDDKPTGPEVTPPPEEAGGGNVRLALQECSEEMRNAKNCATIAKPVCAEVDTGIRCVRAPCPSTAQQTFDNACTACMNKNVRGYWTMSCEAMAKPTAP